jgi:hypothetical protein
MKADSLSDQVKRAKARWLSRVMQHPFVTSTQKCLAYAIANRLNCVTLDCWAAQPTLARDLGHKSIKTVARAGQGLAKHNLITLRRIKSQPGLRYSPILLPEDLDRPVPKTGHRRTKSKDTDDGESFLNIYSESSSTEGAAKEGTQTSNQRPAFSPRERGAVETKLAEKFGANGFDTLARLSAIDDAIIDRLCKVFVEGALSERDIAAARLAAEQS